MPREVEAQHWTAVPGDDKSYGRLVAVDAVVADGVVATPHSLKVEGKILGPTLPASGVPARGDEWVGC